MKYTLAVVALSSVFVPAAWAQGRGPFAGGQEQSLIERFDQDGDERLDADERRAALAWLERQRAGFGGFGRRGFGGRGYAASEPGRRLTPAEVRTYPASVPFYQADVLRTIFLQFENPAWEAELEAFYRTDVEVPATVTVDGTTYRDVGVHFRGMSSFGMVPTGSKRSLNLAFDFVHEGQQVGGYRTLNLLNVNGDPTFVRPVLYAAIARAYIPAPAANYVRVVINGESWGVYVNAQQFNRDFLRDNFSTTDGARWRVPGMPGGRAGMEYLGDDPIRYRSLYDIRTRDTERSWRDLIHLFKVLNETPTAQLEAALAPILDIDETLKFLALDVALVNSDGYWVRASDYSIYRDPQGRFHVIPHDMNEGLADERGAGGRGRGFGFAQGGVELDPLVGLNDRTKPLRSRLLAVPALQERYLRYVRDIAEEWLDWKRLEPMVAGYRALIADEVRLDTRKLYSTDAFDRGIDDPDEGLRAFIERRRAFLLARTASLQAGSTNP